MFYSIYRIHTNNQRTQILYEFFESENSDKKNNYVINDKFTVLHPLKTYVPVDSVYFFTFNSTFVLIYHIFVYHLNVAVGIFHITNLLPLNNVIKHQLAGKPRG